MPYQPAEDSFLLTRILKERVPALLEENPNLRFLEIGSGSGIHLETVSNAGIKKENIFSVDIDPRAVSHCVSLGFNCRRSNLFENVEGKFNIIIFNPPYLPEDSKEHEDSKLQTTGGVKGSEITNRFLADAKKYLKENGTIFLITSSLTKNIEWLDWKKQEVGCEKLFMEKLCVWEISF